MIVAQRTNFLLLALWTLIGLLERSAACKFSPSCLQAEKNENKLQDAVDRQDTQAVCSILPSKIHCLQEAVDACKGEDVSKKSEEGPNVQLTIKLVEKMQLRFEQMCPSYTVPRNNSAARSHPSYCVLVPAFLLATLAFITTGNQWTTLGLPFLCRASLFY